MALSREYYQGKLRDAEKRVDAIEIELARKVRLLRKWLKKARYYQQQINIGADERKAKFEAAKARAAAKRKASVKRAFDVGDGK